MLKLQFPEAVTPESFLHLFWQKRPLLMRGALADYRCPLSPEELAGLACDPAIESRIVVQADRQEWRLHHGPFTEDDFAGLPETRWTLLVQDVDKHLPEIARLLDAFIFLPDWRIDDVMISYAVDGGSVGPHVDEYDVFLLQAEGHRRWRIDTRPQTGAALLPETELQVLADFDAEQEWLLEPGDMLYLPPAVAHWGVAEGDCMTCSIGFRAPGWRELLTDWSEYLIGRTAGDRHYRDPPLSVPASSAEIPDAVFASVDALLEALQRSTPGERRRWFGRLVTEPKPDLVPEPPAAELTASQFHEALRVRGLIHRHPWARAAFATVESDHTVLFVNSREFAVHEACRGLLRTLAHARQMHFGYLDEWLAQGPCLELLTRLYNDGFLVFHDE
jgi:50S ribosomal protein L16 3-hydroxylase